MPLVRFDLNLKLIGSFSIQIPVFQDLKRPASANTPFANPTGHLVTDFLAALPARLVVADRNSARLVWYDLKPLE
jgi:hypothetical protein